MTNPGRLPARTVDQRKEPDEHVRCSLCDQGFLDGEVFKVARECCAEGRAFDIRNGVPAAAQVEHGKATKESLIRDPEFMWAYVEAMRLELDAADKEIERLTLSATAATEYGQLKASQLTDATTELLAARASLTASEKQTWQPIETAPTSIEDVLLLSKDRRVYTAFRGGFDGRWLTRPGTWTVNNPTHWMPLPEPPK